MKEVDTMSDSTTPASDDSELLQAHKAALAAAQRDPLLSPETGKPVPKKTLFRFGASFLAFGILWMSGLGIVSIVLLPEHLKQVPGIAPEALMGI
ncbi:MAG: MFS transporter, partial [Bifidobacteriales bacterium]|nr:MFS transporter [Bifidobacteriales bacterium]